MKTCFLDVKVDLYTGLFHLNFIEEILDFFREIDLVLYISQKFREID